MRILLLQPFPLLFLCGVWVALGASTSAFAENHTAPLPPLRHIKRILFLGDSITYAGEYVEAIDAYLYRQSPDHHYELINIGLPSETVSGLTEPNHAGGAFPRPDLHERLDRALAKVKPDLVVACYGMNDGIYYPFDPGRFAKYQEGIQWLAEKVHHAHAQLWLLTPPPFDSHPIAKYTLPEGRAEYPSGQSFVGYDTVLARYSEWLLSQRQIGWNVIDIHTPLNTYLTERRRTEPDFAFAGDGVHLNALGHRLIAREILRAWGAPDPHLPAIEANTAPSPGMASPESELTTLVKHRQQLLRDSWLADVHHLRPGMPPGVPLLRARQQADAYDAQIRALVATLLKY